MSKYYNKEIPDEINVVYSYRYSGKIYNENKKLEERIKELEEKNKTFEDYNKDLNNQLDKLEEENKKLKEDYDILDKFDDKTIDDYEKLEEENEKLKEENKDLKESNHSWQRKLSYYKLRINKAIEYIEEHKRNVYDTFGEGIVFGEMGGIKELYKILKGEENESN